MVCVSGLFKTRSRQERPSFSRIIAPSPLPPKRTAFEAAGPLPLRVHSLALSDGFLIVLLSWFLCPLIFLHLELKRNQRLNSVAIKHLWQQHLMGDAVPFTFLVASESHSRCLRDNALPVSSTPPVWPFPHCALSFLFTSHYLAFYMSHLLICLCHYAIFLSCTWFFS